MPSFHHERADDPFSNINFVGSEIRSLSESKVNDTFFNSFSFFSPVSKMDLR